MYVIFYLHLVDLYGIHVCKYTVPVPWENRHGSYGLVVGDPAWLGQLHLPLSPDRIQWKIPPLNLYEWTHIFKDSHHYVKLQRNIEQVWNQMKRHPQSLEEAYQAPAVFQRNLQPKHTVANQTVKPNGKPKRCETSNVLWRHVSSVVQSWRPLLKNDGNNMFFWRVAKLFTKLIGKMVVPLGWYPY